MAVTNGAAMAIGEWRFDPTDGSLASDAERKHLDPRVAELLSLFVERAGQVVDKQTILDTVWSGTVVQKDAVTVAVYELRKALGDDARKPRFVETVPKRGYRLVAPVEVVTPPTTRAVPARGWRVAAAVAMLAVGLLAAGAWLSPPPSAERSVIAVLMFEQHGAETDDYLAAGVTDTLTADLTRVPDASVLAHRTVRSLNGVDDEALGELGVTHVVSGSVIPHGERVRINVHLTRRGETTFEWSDTFEGPLSELLGIQRHVAISIAGELGRRLGDEERVAQPAVPAAAMRSYLLGRHYWNQRDAESVRLAVEHFEDALELDPGFARAWAGLADAYTFPGPSLLGLSQEDGYRAARDASEKARELAPELADAYVSSAAIAFVYGWAIADAERDFERALELAPSSALAHQWYAELLSATGRHDTAIAHMREARRLDPRSVSILFDLFWVQYMAGDFETALRTLDETIALSASFGDPDPTLYWTRSRLQARTARLDDALASLGAFYDAYDVSPPPAFQALSEEPSADSFQRYRVEALEAESDRGRTYPFSLAAAYAEAGRTAEALQWLERAAEEKDGAILWIRVNPDLAALHGEPRFRELVDRIGIGGI